MGKAYKCDFCGSLYTFAPEIDTMFVVEGDTISGFQLSSHMDVYTSRGKKYDLCPVCRTRMFFDLGLSMTVPPEMESVKIDGKSYEWLLAHMAGICPNKDTTKDRCSPEEDPSMMAAERATKSLLHIIDTMKNLGPCSKEEK